MVAMRKTLNISMVSNGNCWMSPSRSRCINKIFNSWHCIHSRHVGMRMKFHTLFVPQASNPHMRSMRNLFFNILHIHSQTMSERIILDNGHEPNPVPLFYHIELSELITIFDPSLHSKTRGIISYLKINNNFTRLCFTLLLHQKIYPSKNNTIFF